MLSSFLSSILGDTGVDRMGGKSPRYAEGLDDFGSEDDDKEYIVGSKALSAFEGEVRKLRTMQAEALAGYHEV